jgi:hypothetical protein
MGSQLRGVRGAAPPPVPAAHGVGRARRAAFLPINGLAHL